MLVTSKDAHSEKNDIGYYQEPTLITSFQSYEAIQKEEQLIGRFSKISGLG
jgi:hypothetical protein